MVLDKYLLLARRGSDSEINQWLDQNPLVLGLIALAIGALIGFWGVYELYRGVALDKRGRELTGGQAVALAVIRIVAGFAACLFGIYKMLAG